MRALLVCILALVACDDIEPLPDGGPAPMGDYSIGWQCRAGCETDPSFARFDRLTLDGLQLTYWQSDGPEELFDLEPRDSSPRCVDGSGVWITGGTFSGPYSLCPDGPQLVGDIRYEAANGPAIWRAALTPLE